MASLALAFDILARDKASKELNQIGDAAQRTGGKLDGLKGVASGVGKVLGGVAVGGLAAFGAALFQGGKDAVAFETLTKKTEAVIKSTGNVAGISVKGVQSLAGSLESLSGVDEELIINSQNVLATFTRIRNTDASKTFDDAAKAALNMSVALNQDLQSATILVGKALNDPIKGLTALNKAGVTFTEEQKGRIKWLAENNRVMEAQGIILGELETQFGGVAEAAGSGLAGSMARLKDAFGDAFRELATAALPTLTSLAEWLAARLPTAIDVAKRALGPVADALGRFGGVVSEFWYSLTTGFTEDEGTPVERAALRVREAIGAISDWWDENGTGIVDGLRAIGWVIIDPVIASFVALWETIRDDVIPRLVDFADWIKDNKPALAALAGAVGTVLVGALVSYTSAAAAATAANVALGLSWVAASWPLIALAALIGGSIALFVHLWTEVDTFRIKMKQAFLAAYIVWQEFGVPIVDGITDIIDALKGAVRWVNNLIDAIDHIPSLPSGVGGGGLGLGDVLTGLGAAGIPIPGRALGGPVRAGMPYVVGEHRPELFVPSQNGTIIPSVGGATVIQNVYNPVPEPASDSVVRLREVARGL